MLQCIDRQPWIVPFGTDLFGGEAELHWTYNGVDQATLQFRICGTNSDYTTATTTLQQTGYWFAPRVAWHEASMSPFLRAGPHAIYQASLSSSNDYWVNASAINSPVSASQLLTATAARLNYVTGVLAQQCAPGGSTGCISQDADLAAGIVSSLGTNPGFQLGVNFQQSPINWNSWTMLDGPGIAADCISLSALGGLALALLGIQGDAHFAYPTGVVRKDFTDTVNQASGAVGNGNVTTKLVYLDTSDCENNGEGFLRAVVSAGEMGWTVAPYYPKMTPISTGLGVTPTEIRRFDGKVYNNLLFYRVLYNTLTSISAYARSNNLNPLYGQQVWMSNGFRRSVTTCTAE